MYPIFKKSWIDPSDPSGKGRCAPATPSTRVSNGAAAYALHRFPHAA